MGQGLLAAAWVLVATAAVTGLVRVRASRRRMALNRALHELRRPLQALALTPGPARRQLRAPGSLELALAALDDLDVAINGSRPALARRPVAARPLLEAAVERWRGVAARRERSLAFEWAAGRAILIADPVRLGQALDNLLANAIEHGALRVVLRVDRSSVGLRIAVLTAVGPSVASAPDPRRGHGLAVVERVAAAHFGRFTLRRGPGDVEAVLELPLTSQPLPAAPIEWAPRAARAAGRRRRGSERAPTRAA